MTFEGSKYRTCDNWFDFIPLKNEPIKYLEIGIFYGANLLSVADEYGKHELSKLYCVDPWVDYKDYSEYKNEQPKIYKTFLKNIANSTHTDKIQIYRDFSNNIIPKFDDDYFDIIYIDGNHEPEYVLEDAVLSFRKLKINGYIVFDDYGWGGHDLTQRGIDGFISGYHKRIKVLGERNTQMFIQRVI